MKPTYRSAIFYFLLFFLVLFLWQCGHKPDTVELFSPDNRIKVLFALKEGSPYYAAFLDNRAIINPSKLGFILKDALPLSDHFLIKEKHISSKNEQWTQVWGEVKDIQNHYNELRLLLEQSDNLKRQLVIVFRIFNDGIGFRYEFPEQENLKEFQIVNEATEFCLAGDHQTWWIPAFWDNRYEYLFTSTPVSKIKSDTVRAVHTPLTMETRDGLFLSIHAANLTDYASMTLAVKENSTVLQCELVPWSDGIKVKAATPFQTPWRTIQIAENPAGLITSHLILNLNEPCQLKDISWIKPGKYVGIWWGMHTGKYSWSSGEKHGATTENTKRYIDFAAKHGFDGVLVEGWNIGWDGNWLENGEIFSFTQPYADFDTEQLSSYAKAKGVKLIGHHETGAAVLNYEKQVEDAFKQCQRLGINAVKTGYVGYGTQIKKVDQQGDTVAGEWHHGQYMVRHYRKIVELAAQYHIMLDVHEPIKDTGIRRTYPNMMTREGARGQEYNAWSPDGGNPPDYTTIIPFTRCLAGPFDFTPGIFDLYGGKGKDSFQRVRTTLAKQLALYVTIFSPLHMAADLPENYENQPAFQFIKDVPVDWEITMVPHAQIGDYITIVRKDRYSADWYLGSITDENGRTLTVSLRFLEPDKNYVAEIYTDAPDANWQDNPLAIEIKSTMVDAGTVYRIELAPGGGTAIRFRPAKEDDLNSFERYK
jgi:alpha-glucosidase